MRRACRAILDPTSKSIFTIASARMWGRLHMLARVNSIPLSAFTIIYLGLSPSRVRLIAGMVTA